MTWFLQISLLQHVMTVFLPISCHFVCNYGIMVSFFSHWHLHIKNQNKLQTWRLGSTAKKCRTCINALHVILLSIRHWSVKPCLGNVRTKQRSPAQFHDQHHNINRFRQHCVLWNTASPECSPGSAESDQRCNKPHKEKWADTDRQILIIFKITDWNWIKLPRNNCKHVFHTWNLSIEQCESVCPESGQCYDHTLRNICWKK